MITLIKNKIVSQQSYIKVIIIASIMSLQEDAGGLKKGVELSHDKIYRVALTGVAQLVRVLTHKVEGHQFDA